MNEQRWEQAVSLMAERTARGTIHWEPVPHARRQCTAGDSVVGVPYTGSVLGRTFLVYEFEYRSYHDEDSYSIATDVSIEVVNNELELEFRLPKTLSRWKLLEAIRERASGAIEFLDEFLKGDDEVS